MKKTILTSFIITVLFSFLSSDLMARGRCPMGECPQLCDGPCMMIEGPPPGREHRMKGHHKGMFFGNPERMKAMLGLTDDQVEKISEINLNYKKKLLDYREKLAPKKIKLKKMLLEEKVDLGKIKDLLKEMSEIKIEIRMLRIMQRLEIEKVLTPSQRIKFRNHRGGMGQGPFKGDGNI